MDLLTKRHIIYDISELNLRVNDDVSVIGFRQNGLWIPVSRCLPWLNF